LSCSISAAGVTVSPISQWTSQQIREAFPWESAPRYLIRDRDASHGVAFRSRMKAMDHRGVERIALTLAERLC
jgi:hypothetical protein